MKKLLGLSIATIGVVATIGILFGIPLDDAENNIQNVPELTTPTYIPSDITKANPNFVVTSGGASFTSMTATQIIEAIDYVLEGIVTDIDEPILYVSSSGSVQASIPITMSVEKIHKGNLESDTFTFYVSAGVMIDNKFAYSYTAISKDVPYDLPLVFQDYTINEILNSENIRYRIHDEKPQFEINDKIIVSLTENVKLTEKLEQRSIVMISDYDLIPYYTIPYGKIGVIKIQDDVLFDHVGNMISTFADVTDDVLFDSRGIPIPYVDAGLIIEETP